MGYLIHKIYSILNEMKGFTPGITSRSKNKMIIDYNGKRYIATFEEIENPDENIFKDIDKYLG